MLNLIYQDMKERYELPVDKLEVKDEAHGKAEMLPPKYYLPLGLALIVSTCLGIQVNLKFSLIRTPLTISAYYFPSLTDLDKQLPKADFPAPANKDNPLSQFASTDPQS